MKRRPFLKTTLALAALFVDGQQTFAGGPEQKPTAEFAPADKSDREFRRLVIDTADVERFYRVFDAAGGHPTAADLQRHYVDAGSDGLRQFARLRDLSGETLAAAVAKDPAPFEKARGCVVLLPAVRERVSAALAKLALIDPRATFPPVTIVIGRAKTGGTTSSSGVLVGLETICSADFLEANLEDRLVHLITHEYGHVQQSHAEETDRPGATLLFASLIEGGAELVGELIGGSVAYPHLQKWAQGREDGLARTFLAERGKTDLSAWLYNGLGTLERPGDLGYLMGYRIAKAYYDRSSDKERALADILQVSPESAEALLQQSGFIPPAALVPPQP